MNKIIIISLMLITLVFLINGCSPSESEVTEKGEAVVDQPLSEAPKLDITAFEVGELLQSKGITFIAWECPFLDDNYIVEVAEISDAMKEKGMLSKAMAVTELDNTLYDWHIEVYESIEARNEARIFMVDANPGAAHFAECGEILVIIWDAFDKDENRELSRRAFTILRDNLQCQ